MSERVSEPAVICTVVEESLRMRISGRVSREFSVVEESLRR